MTEIILWTLAYLLAGYACVWGGHKLSPYGDFGTLAMVWLFWPILLAALILVLIDEVLEPVLAMVPAPKLPWGLNRLLPPVGRAR